MPTPESLADKLRSEAERSNHRLAIVLCGERDWGVDIALRIASAKRAGKRLWVSDAAPVGQPVTDNSRISQVLGSETDTIVYDAWAGFDPDAFGAVTGTLRGGGLLLLLTPPLGDWAHYDDPDKQRIATYPYTVPDLGHGFLTRLARLIRSSDSLIRVEQGQPLPNLPAPAPHLHNGHYREGDYRTRDQMVAVRRIESTTYASGRPVVLTADRGRGKSAALGIAAAHLMMRAGAGRVLVTAPRMTAVAAVFEHARQLLPEARMRRGQIDWHEASLEFAPPDSLVQQPRHADLLLVDEAAAIPTPMLADLLHHYPRVVFATTIHGYEGTGRGFAVRFRDILDRRAPGWRQVRLHTPIRWAADDPLEAFVFEALMLAAEPAPADAFRGLTSPPAPERLERGQLVEDAPLLTEIFGLMVLAHYQTRPMDLRNLLDGPALDLWVIRHRGHVAAAAIVAREGGLRSGLTYESWLGRRRPRGHLLPESLISQAGFPEVAPLRCARVMRIAVHPAARRLGLGTRLLQAIGDAARADGLDYTGASFGATTDLLDFWTGNGMQPMRLGSRRDAASGTHAVMVIKPLTTAAEEVFAAVRARFAEELPVLLEGPAHDVEEELRARLVRAAPEAGEMSLRDWMDLYSFANGSRKDDHCLLALRRLYRYAQAHNAWEARLTPAQRSLYRARIIDYAPWTEAAPAGGVHGRRQGLEMLREIAGALLDHLAPPGLEPVVRRIREEF